MSHTVTCPRCGHAFPLADPGPEPRGDIEFPDRTLTMTEESCSRCDGLGCPECHGTGRRLVHNTARTGQDDQQPPPALLRAATAVCEAMRTDELACRLGPLSDALRELDHVINPRPRLEPTRGAYAEEAWHPGAREVPDVVGRAREAPDA